MLVLCRLASAGSIALPGVQIRTPSGRRAPVHQVQDHLLPVGRHVSLQPRGPGLPASHPRPSAPVPSPTTHWSKSGLEARLEQRQHEGNASGPDVLSLWSPHTVTDSHWTTSTPCWPPSNIEQSCMTTGPLAWLRHSTPNSRRRRVRADRPLLICHSPFYFFLFS